MPKLRKPLKRPGKKMRVQSLRNPFNQQSLPYLPTSIAQNLKNLEHIVLRHIDQIVCQPLDSPEINLQFMREALYQQQLKISNLKYTTTPCSNKIKSTTQPQYQEYMGMEEKSSNEELEVPVGMGQMDWMLDRVEFIDLF